MVILRDFPYSNALFGLVIYWPLSRERIKHIPSKDKFGAYPTISCMKGCNPIKPSLCSAQYFSLSFFSFHTSGFVNSNLFFAEVLPCHVLCSRTMWATCRMAHQWTKLAMPSTIRKLSSKSRCVVKSHLRTACILLCQAATRVNTCERLFPVHLWSKAWLCGTVGQNQSIWFGYPMNYNVLSIFCADFGSINLISRIFQEINGSLSISVFGPWCNRTVRGESWGNVMWWIWLQIILCTESDWHPRICHMTCCIFLTHKEDFYLDFGAKTHRWKAPPAALVFDVGSMLSGDDWPWSSFSWFPPAHLSICGRHRLPGGWHWFAKGRQCH